MRIHLLAFASAGDALGATEMDLEMPEGSRVADLRARLDQDHPKLAPLWPRLAVAVDGRVATPEATLAVPSVMTCIHTRYWPSVASPYSIVEAPNAPCTRLPTRCNTKRP